MSLEHPLNRVSEKLFEDSVNKTFTYVSKPKDQIESRVDYDAEAFSIEGLKLGSDGGLVDPSSCIQFDLTNKSFEVKKFEEVVADGWRVTKNKQQVDLL